MKAVLFFMAMVLCTVNAVALERSVGGYVDNGSYRADYQENHDNDSNNANSNLLNQNNNHPSSGTYVEYGAYGNTFFYRGLYFPPDTPDGFTACTESNSFSYCENYYSYYPYAATTP